MASELTQYSKIWVADFFHSFPHLNFSISSVNKTFNPTNDEYKEAALILGLLPLCLCVVTWILLIIYFIQRCCQDQNIKKNPSLCSCVFTFLFILVVIGLTGFGFYQNEATNRGVEGCRRAVIDANSTVTLAQQQVKTLYRITEEIAGGISDDIQDVIVKHIDNDTVVEKVLEKITHIRTNAKTMRSDLDGIHIKAEFGGALDTADDVEYWRRAGTITVFSLYLGLTLLILIGLLIKSKALLLISVFLAILCSLFIWATAGVYLSGSVVLSDLCESPDNYFLSVANGTSNEEEIKAYITCVDTTLPYSKPLQDALNAISAANKDVNDTLKLAKPFDVPELAAPVLDLQWHLSNATGNISSLLTNVGLCTELHGDYVMALNAACRDTLSGTALLTLVCVIIACVTVVIIMVLPCVWANYQRMRQRADYLNIDDSDPFLPRPPQYEADYGAIGRSTPRPWSERGTLQHGEVSDDSVLMTSRVQHPPPRSDSPPPAYAPGPYNMRQYTDSSRPGSSQH